MKIAYYSFALLLFLSGNLYSQITIDATDAPPIGTVLYYSTDTLLSGVDAGMSGTGQNWDFTGFDEDESLVNNVVDPATTPSANLFAEANLAFESDDLYSYALVDESGLYALGGSALQEGLEFTAFFDPPQLLLQNPTTYETTFTSEFGFQLELDGSILGLDSIRVHEVGFASSEADASGTVSVPAGDFESLRVYTETNTIDSIWIKFFGTWSLIDVSENTSYTYEWWVEGGLGTVASMEVDADGNALSIQYLTDYNIPAVAPLAAFEWTQVSIEEGSVDFTDLSSNNPTSWLWDFGDGNTSELQNPSHIFVAAGTYNVCLTATNGAGSDMICEEINLVINSVDELVTSSDIITYPNPAIEQLYLKSDALGGKLIKGTIFNAVGQVVQHFQLSSVNEAIYVGQLESGNYFLELSVEGKYYRSIPFVKE